MTFCTNSTSSAFEPREETDTFLQIVMYLIAIIGILANITVIIVFVNCKIHRRSFTYLLVFQQSVIDLYASAHYFIFFCIQPVPTEKINDAFCKLGTIFLFFLSASTLNLVFISVERYVAVVYPLKYWIRGNSKRSMIKHLGIPFLAAFIITVQYAFISEEDIGNPGTCVFCYRSEGLQILSSVSLLLANAVIPITVMTFCYRRVYVTLNKQMKVRAELTMQSLTNTTPLRESSNDARAENADTSAQSRRNDDAERNFIVTMCINTVVYIICVIPLILLYLIYTICQCFDVNNHVSRDIGLLFVLSNTAVNPFVYAYKFNEYREGFSKTFCQN
ncbi:octopamine receptor beta-2R-like [Antedon mediterranea]|uniref:octopamine receptor beta-2R-like n=1 Tax=Antedon mediterranea TaxID=105859 RepID=UPI003AF96A20